MALVHLAGISVLVWRSGRLDAPLPLAARERHLAATVALLTDERIAAERADTGTQELLRDAFPPEDLASAVADTGRETANSDRSVVVQLSVATSALLHPGPLTLMGV